MKRWNLILIGAAVVAAAAVAQMTSTGAVAAAPPFEPLGAVNSISALRANALPALPARVARLSDDLAPAMTAVRPLGRAGHVWLGREGGVCVIMENGAGGCFETFQSPVLLFLSGTRTEAGYGPQTVRGVVADSVASVVLVTDVGERVPTALSGNGLEASLAPGVAITGQQVTFKNGKTYLYADPVSLPR